MGQEAQGERAVPRGVEDLAASSDEDSLKLRRPGLQPLRQDPKRRAFALSHVSLDAYSGLDLLSLANVSTAMLHRVTAGQAGQRATGSPSSALWQSKLESDLLDQGCWASGGHSITRNMKGQPLVMIRRMSYRQQDARSASIRTPHSVCHL